MWKETSKILPGLISYRFYLLLRRLFFGKLIRREKIIGGLL